MMGSNFSSTAVAKEPVHQAVKVQSSVQQSSMMQQLPGVQQQSSDVQLTEEEQRFIDLTNSERLLRGMNALKFDPQLVEVAREHSKEMAEKNYFDHISPTPGLRTAVDRYLAVVKRRPTWALVGENLFYCSIVDVNRGHTCLMESKSHRDNILNPRFERMGVGVYKDKDGQFWVTEMFLAIVD